MEFQVLGPVRMVQDGAAVAVVGTLQRTLLAVLLARAGTPVPVDVLTEQLWPGDRANRAQRLQLHVHRLRRLLDDPGRIVFADDTYLLRVDPGELDAARFEGLAAEAADVTGADPERGATLARAALRLWHGRPFGDLDVPLLADEGRRLTERRLDVAELRYEAELRCDRHAEVIGELTDLAAAHPLRERLCGLLMTALYRVGRQADALAAFRTTRRTLVAELGLEPGAELRTIHHQILRGDGVELNAPAPRRAAPAQLPYDVPDFVGRLPELAVLDDDLRDLRERRSGPTRIRLVAGTAGVGKTALVVHWAHRTRAQFPDGQLYVDLRGYGPGEPAAPGDALTGFLRALGVEAPQIPADLDERAAKFRSLVDGRRILVLLDNARSADQVRPLLPGSPSCLVLVTSRDSLGGLVAREGARRIDLDRLEPDDALDLLRRLTGGRADAEPEAVVALAEQCARLPLALRIAAEAGTGTIAELVADLRGDQLDVLDAGGDPHTEIRTVFSWSYRHLPAGAAQLFRLMGLHPGRTVCVYGLTALTDRDHRETRRMLEPLVRAHLVEKTLGDRFGMHDLLRAYAAELADQEETPQWRRQARRRLFGRYLKAAVAARDLLVPESPPVPLDGVEGIGPDAVFDDLPAVLAWYEAERTTLVAVVRAAASHGDDDIAWRLATALLNFFNLTKHWDDWIDTHQVGLEAAVRVGDRFGEGCVLNGLGVAYDDLGRFDESIECHHRAGVLFEAIGEDHRNAWNLNNLGVVYDRSGRLDEALEQHQRALVLFGAAGDRRGESFSLNNLADVHRQRGEFSPALAYVRQALDLQCDSGDVHAQRFTLCTMGDLHRDAGDARLAISLYDQALEISRAHGDRYQAAMLLTRLAELHQSAAHLRDALDLMTEVGDNAAAADIRARLAELPV